MRLAPHPVEAIHERSLLIAKETVRRRDRDRTGPLRWLPQRSEAIAKRGMRVRRLGAGGHQALEPLFAILDVLPDLGTHFRERSGRLSVLGHALEQARPERSIEQFMPDLDRRQRLRDDLTTGHIRRVSIGQQFLLPRDVGSAGVEPRHVEPKQKIHVGRHRLLLLEHLQKTHPGEPGAVHPARKTSVGERHVPEFVGDDGANLIWRQRGEQRVAQAERVSRPEHTGARCLQRRCIVRGGDDDAVNRGRADTPGDLLHLAIQRPAELRTDVDAFRLGKGKPQRSKHSGGYRHDGNADQNRRDGDERAAGEDTPDEEHRHRQKDGHYQREIGVALENEEEQTQTPRSPDALARRLVHARSSPSSSAASALASSVSILWSTSSCTCGSRPQCRASSKLSMASSNRPSIWSACPSAACAVPR